MIIDTFPFNKDFNALEIRFEELRGVVDLFVASEASFTHSGLPKPLHLSDAKKIQKEMGDQLKIIASTKKRLTNNPRIREMLQRQELTKFLKSLNLSTSDLIMHSDCDEIPRSSIIMDLAKSKDSIDVILELTNYANYLNAYDGVWPRGRVQSFSKFKSIQHMRADLFIQTAYSQRRHNLPFLRLTDYWTTRRYPFYLLPVYIRKPELQTIANAGWHFNNLVDVNDIIYKIESSSHAEWNTEEVRLKALKNYKSASDIYTGELHQIVEIDESYPRAITEKLEKWNMFIYNLDSRF